MFYSRILFVFFLFGASLSVISDDFTKYDWTQDFTLDLYATGGINTLHLKNSPLVFRVGTYHQTYLAPKKIVHSFDPKTKVAKSSGCWTDKDGDEMFEFQTQYSVLDATNVVVRMVQVCKEPKHSWGPQIIALPITEEGKDVVLVMTDSLGKSQTLNPFRKEIVTAVEKAKKAEFTLRGCKVVLLPGKDTTMNIQDTRMVDAKISSVKVEFRTETPWASSKGDKSITEARIQVFKGVR